MSSPFRLRFNKSSLESLPLSVGRSRATYYDTEVLGLQLRVTGRGVKSFCVFRRSKRGRPERITIGRLPTLSVEQARAKAKRYLADLGEGISVSARLRNETLIGKTLGEVHREYLSSRGVSIISVKRKDGRLVERPELGPNAKLKALTTRDYVKLMTRQFADWRAKPIVSITRDMVEPRHRDLTALSPAEANRAMRYLRPLFVFASDYRDSSGEAVIPDNPVRRLSAKRLWNRIERRTRYVEPEQLRDWWNAVQSLKNKPQYPSREVLRDYLLLLLFTGLRRNEALFLRWESRLGDHLSYYTTKRLLNHRTSDVTQGYIQFDLEQLRCAMQAVEDFVMKNAGISAGSDETRKSSNASLTRRRHVNHAVHI